MMNQAEATRYFYYHIRISKQ